jgi:hypothetical protein
MQHETVYLHVMLFILSGTPSPLSLLCRMAQS